MLEDNTKRMKKEQTEPPEELISTEMVEFISSEKTSSQIADICLQSGIENEVKIEEVSYRIALVILSALPKESLTIALENGVGLDAQTAKKISAEVNRLIFSQIQQRQPKTTNEAEKTISAKEETKKETPQEIKKPSKKDIYKEPIE